MHYFFTERSLSSFSQSYPVVRNWVGGSLLAFFCVFQLLCCLHSHETVYEKGDIPPSQIECVICLAAHMPYDVGDDVAAVSVAFFVIFLPFFFASQSLDLSAFCAAPARAPPV